MVGKVYLVQKEHKVKIACSVHQEKQAHLESKVKREGLDIQELRDFQAGQEPGATKVRQETQVLKEQKDFLGQMGKMD
jgi:hypothetical protein